MVMNCFHSAFKKMSLLLILVYTFTFTNAQGFSTETQNRLQQVLQNFQDQSGFTGGISAAINVDGLATWEGATGFAARNVDAQNNLLPGGTSFTTATLSRIYSVTKTFTAALVLELVKKGEMSLDDPIIQYMPYLNYANPNLNGNATIRQLLYHESGYSDWEENLNLQIAIAFDPSHVWNAYELAYFTEQLSAPGAERRYSHNNYVFLGAAIEAATGETLQDLYRDYFFTPLNLGSMYMDGREAHGSRPPLAAPHDNISPFNPIFQFTGQPTFPNSYTNISAFNFTAITSLGSAGGALIGDASDLATFSNALFGNRITSPGIVDEMLASISATPDAYGNLLGYGVKNTDNISGDYDFIGHNGSAPGYRSAMFYNHDRKMTIVVLTNFAGVDPYAISAALFEALPEFICGNEERKENKIRLCFNENVICVDRHAAAGHISKDAYLGGCEAASSKSITTTVAETNPAALVFRQYPNPSIGTVHFEFNVSKAGKVLLELYDLNGRLVSKIYEGYMETGPARKSNFNTSSLSSGVYITRLQTADGVKEQKLIVGK